MFGIQPRNKNWTPEKEEKLTELWERRTPSGQQLSASQIARELGPEFTKNAVVGKAHRMKLAGRPSPIREADPLSKMNLPKTRRKAIASATEQSPALTYIAQPSQKPKKRVGRIGKCQWPFGHPGDKNFRFCEKNTIPDKPYCKKHYNKAYVAPKKEVPQKKSKADNLRETLRVQVADRHH